MTKIHYKFFVTLALLATVGASPSFSQMPADDTLSCKRLDILQLNVSPAELVSEANITYIERFVSNKCIQSSLNVSPVSTALDLEIIEEIYSVIPSSVIFKNTNNAALRVENVRAKIRATRSKMPKLRQNAMQVTSHDVAASQFLGCVVTSRMNYKTCDGLLFDVFLKSAEASSHSHRVNIVKPIIGLSASKRGHRKNKKF